VGALSRRRRHRFGCVADAACDYGRSIAKGSSLHVLHAYKTHRADQDGGIPEAIATLAASAATSDTASILAARRYRGFARDKLDGPVPVRLVTSAGNLLSMPIAPSYVFALRRAARTADVVVHHAPFPLNDLAVAGGFPENTALVVHWHADIVGRPRLMRLLDPLLRRSLERADRIVICDDALLRASQLLPGFAGKCVVIPYGTDVRYWEEPGAVRGFVDHLRRQHPRLIVALGRLVAYKGFDVLVRALVGLDATVVIIGDGPLGESLPALAHRLGVADRLLLVGRCERDRIKAYLHAARAFVFPSVTRAESFGIAQLEAMAASLPIVNTALPTAVPRVARDGLEALTVPPGDADALANALTRLLDDPPLARGLGAAGRRRVGALYDRATFVARLQEVYRDVAGERSAVRSSTLDYAAHGGSRAAVR
jgi:glycosyltransferase involved in cell wall biosynthesis